jgi:hypothetical protein
MACECPTKLFYTKKKAYKDNGLDDPFLAALRDGGFQVGELARQYYGKGVLIDTLDEAEALKLTAAEMSKPKALIFEAAFLYQNLFIRADIVQKIGNSVRLIEVKSKSIRLNDPKKPLLTEKGFPTSKWDLTMQDIAFQTYVLEQAHPELEIEPYLMLLDKEKQAVVDAMNSYFFLQKRGDRNNPEVVLSGSLPPQVLQKGKWILCEIPVRAVVKRLHDLNYENSKQKITFAQRAKDWSDHYAKDKKIAPILTSECRDCQFRANPDERKKGLLSGYHECWRAVSGLPDAKLDSGTVVEIWQYRKKEQLLQQGIYHQTQVKPEIFTGSFGPRQQQQVTCVQKKITTPMVDLAGLATDLSRLEYPLHFIDFETIRGAIPFHKDSAPYEQVAFQFSHHVVEKNGTIRHEGEWISLKRGQWPNADFLKELQKELSKDGGSILHYANHEQQVLGDMADQVERTDPPLASWARGLMDSSKGDHGQGMGRMVDLKKILEARYYHPLAGGSNSLKKILPAILQTSSLLRKKYSSPIYGTPSMPSRNFKAMTWIQGKSDPYELLPPVSADIPLDVERVFGENDKIDQGGAAMTAYAKVQFTQCSAAEVAGVEKALLKYCELDTLAMVMLWEEWQDQLQNGKPTAAAAPTQKAAIQTGKAFKKNSLSKVLKST